MKKKYSRILLLIFFSLFINSKIFAEIKFKEVVVTGIGQSLDEATNNAFAEAISMVNGKNVQTKTIIKVLSGEPLPKEPESQGENANFFAKILVQLTDSSKEKEEKPRHPLSEVFDMYIRNFSAVCAMLVLIVIIILAIFGPSLYPTDPFEMVWMPFSPPGQEGFLLGTDYLGRDLMAGLVHGARVSILVGISAAFMSVVIGITIGALAGYYRGTGEEILMRLTEFFQVLPTLLFSMVIVALFGASLPMIVIAIGLRVSTVQNMSNFSSFMH